VRCAANPSHPVKKMFVTLAAVAALLPVYTRLLPFAPLSPRPHLPAARYAPITCQKILRRSSELFDASSELPLELTPVGEPRHDEAEVDEPATDNQIPGTCELDASPELTFELVPVAKPHDNEAHNVESDTIDLIPGIREVDTSSELPLDLAPFDAPHVDEAHVDEPATNHHIPGTHVSSEVPFELVPLADPHADQAQDDKPETDGHLPGIRELAAFCLPTLSIWLSSPLLSLIDTSIVGLKASGVHQLAALAPSTKLCDYVAFLCTAMGAATTNLAADALAKDLPGTAKTIVGSSITLSLTLGVVVAAVMGALAGPAMSAMLGSGACPLVLEAATAYTGIRALGYPAALLTMVLQAGFVAVKDTNTPLLAVPVVAGVNLILDLLLVGPLKMGAAGAAWATTAALNVNAGMLLLLWRKKMQTLRGRNVLFKRPSGSEVKALVKFAAPMMVALVARVYMGLSMTLSAVALGTSALAANQVIDSLYWLFCPFGEGLSLCMQAYLPPLLYKGRSLAQRLQKTTLRGAGVLGLCAAAGAALLPVRCSGLFTTSAPVLGIMAATAPSLAFALAAYVVACTMEGMVIARAKVRFLALIHTVNTVVLSFFLSRVVRWGNCGLQHVWALFGLCHLIRLVELSAFLRRCDAEAVASSQWLGGLRARVRKMRRRNFDAVIPSIADTHPDLLF